MIIDDDKVEWREGFSKDSWYLKGIAPFSCSIYWNAGAVNVSVQGKKMKKTFADRDEAKRFAVTVLKKWMYRGIDALEEFHD